MEVHLAAVQVAWSPALYASPDAFRERMLALGDAAVADAGDAARLVAFPELLALPLLLTARGDPEALRAPTFGAALARLARSDLRRWLATAWRLRAPSAAAVYGSYAVDAYRLWHDTFAEVARRCRAVVVAGTAFLPDVDHEPSSGWHVRDLAVHNVALTFAPSGACLARTAKVHLTPGAEQRAGLRRGRIEDLWPVDSAVGRVAVAVCLDGFHERVMATLDARGAEIVVQPSANDAPWDRPWPRDPSRLEGDVWLAEGLRATVQRRKAIRYGVNPMMVGDAFGLQPRGRSSLVANRALVGASPRVGSAMQGLLAIAPDAVSEAIVTVRVPHPDDVGSGPEEAAATR